MVDVAGKRRGRKPSGPETFSDRFRHFSDRMTHALGTPWTLLAAVLLIVVWALTGPIFGFSDTWQLVINTTTTIITFLMVFVIQTSQNRESKAIQLKLDELIMANEAARNQVMLANKDSEAQLADLEKGFDKIAHEVPDTPKAESQTPGPGKGTLGGAGTAARKR